MKVASISFKLLTAIAGVIGVSMSFANAGVVQMLGYYTILSNLICIAVMLFIAILMLSGKTPQQQKWYPYLRGATTTCILVTFLVFHFFLAPTMFQMGDYMSSFQNILLHYAVPLMVLLDYLLFDPKGEYRPRHVFVWMLIPLLYPVYCIGYKALGGTFGGAFGVKSSMPYFFLQYDVIGYWSGDVLHVAKWGVFNWIIAIIIGFFILSYILILIDWLLGKLTRKKA